MHIHVSSGDGEAKFWLSPGIEPAEVHRLSQREITKIVTIIAIMSSKSEMLGNVASEVEVTNISRHGFWIFLGDRELFVPFTDFPWFAEAPVNKITDVEWPSPDHLYWPALDIDLSVRSIEHPEEFPLRYSASND